MKKSKGDSKDINQKETEKLYYIFFNIETRKPDEYKNTLYWTGYKEEIVK